MKIIRYVSRLFPLAIILAMTACTDHPPANSNQRTANANSANASQSNTSQSKPSQQPAQSTTGSIEVISNPPGARVLLISNDEGGAGEPQSKGLTPTMITGVAPGKYTVHLERPGYRFSQDNVEIKAGQTIKINKFLKKQ